ncbi:hypothetical protein HMPREF3040_04544, partial [Escherichia coli]
KKAALRDLSLCRYLCRLIWQLKAYCFPVWNISDKKFKKR